MLAGYKWATTSWKNRSSKIFRWFCFWEAEQQDALPAEEGDALAYVGFLSVEGPVNPLPAKQHEMGVSQYRLGYGFQSPKPTRTATPLLDAYESRDHRAGEP